MTTPNPWERLREAAEMVLPYLPVGGKNWIVPAFAFVELGEALAALPATTPEQPVPDEERERAIEAWRKEATRVVLERGVVSVFRVTCGEIDDAVALMRSAPAPQPAVEPVHLSSMMHPEFVTCGIECTPSVKRTRRKPGVTCHECLRVAEMGDEAAAKPVTAPPASDWRERFDSWVTPGSLIQSQVAYALHALRDGLAALEAEMAKLKEKP